MFRCVLLPHRTLHCTTPSHTHTEHRRRPLSLHRFPACRFRLHCCGHLASRRLCLISYRLSRQTSTLIVSSIYKQMPPVEMADVDKNKIQQSWADQMDEDHPDLPQDSERIEGNQKIVTHWDLDEDGNRVKYIRYFKFETIKVPKSVARRKAWKKFGKAANDPPGPNPANTTVNDEVKMDFIREKENQSSSSVQDDALKNAKLGKGFVKCRFCEMDHWSTSCPYKDKLAPRDESGASGMAAALKASEDEKGPKKYVVPSMREGANRKGEMMPGSRSKDEANTIRVTNLPEDIQDSDIKELFATFGRILRIFLARDKHTGQSKGFAFVSFDKKEDAARAVAAVNGHGYANLILNVEWAKPSGNN